jgi:hypothetical protein
VPWISINTGEQQDIRQVMSELDHDSERAAAIVGAVLVEESLGALLRARLQPDDDLLNEMLRSSGPLGPFSVKINMAYLMGLYSKTANKELDTIRGIRNQFAHYTNRSFEYDRIRERANNLSLSERAEFYMTLPVPEGGEGTVLWMGGKPPTDHPHRVIPVLDPIPAEQLTPRKRYMRACQFFTAALLFVGHSPRGQVPHYF